MKRYIILSIFGSLAFVFLFILHQKSESKFTKNYQEVLSLFLTARQVETSLEKDLLKSRNFLLLTYDSIVENEKEVEDVCTNMHSPSYSIYKSLDHNLDLAIDEYCAAVSQKMKKVEIFKSRNAILKNSLFYIQNNATERSNETAKSNLGEVFFQNRLIELCLAYALVTNDISKDALRVAIEAAQKTLLKMPADSEFSIIVSHANKVLEVKGSLDSLTKEIINSDSTQLLEKARQSYFHSYSKAESTAHVFRDLLFLACTIFLGFIIYNIILLWKAAQKLTQVNESLEQRVRDRTKELNDTKETILQQQQTLVSSAKMSSLGEMAGGVAHEINTPLAIIGLKIEQLEKCLMDDIINPMDLIEGLEAIKSTTQRISKIISGLRFFARDGKSLPTQLTTIEAIVEDTFSFCKEKFSNHGVQLELKNDSISPLQLKCRSVEISQVLLNLLNNAFDSIESQKNKWVRVGIADKNDFIELTVTDSGLGISKEIQDKIMQPFFTTKPVGKGTGLGLSISRGIIESHQGKLFLNADTPNTCFTILLPKEPEDQYLKKSA